MPRPIEAGVLLGCLVLTAATAASQGDVGSITLALGSRAEALIVARCSVCHSPDLIAQQRLPHDRWEAIVEKMKHWGAQISQEEGTVLIRYLSARYHLEAPDRLPPYTRPKTVIMRRNHGNFDR